MDAILRRSLVTGLAVLLFSTGLLSGQRRTPRRVIPVPKRQAAKPAPTKRLSRDRLQSPDLRVQKLDPKLKAVLDKWEQATAKIKTMQGLVYRYRREFVFYTEKRASGKFYYKAPDKGHIDLRAITIARGTTSSVKGPSTKDAVTGRIIPGRKIPLSVTSDVPEKWICDGTQILQFNEAQRTVVSHKIPKKFTGENIMDGPLPFLIGMPAEKAVKRYRMELLGVTGTEAWLRAWPRWKQDAANYREATVILDASTYLPKHVRLTAPDNTQTIYSFARVKVNSRLSALTQFLPGSGGDPFRPNLKPYRVIAAKSEYVVPSVVGMPWQKARDVLKTAGFKKVRYKHGLPATSRKALYVVYQQAPRQPPPGGLITLTVYSKPKTETRTRMR